MYNELKAQPTPAKEVVRLFSTEKNLILDLELYNLNGYLLRKHYNK